MTINHQNLYNPPRKNPCARRQRLAANPHLYRLNMDVLRQVHRFKKKRKKKEKKEKKTTKKQKKKKKTARTLRSYSSDLKPLLEV
jgi:hypothetical protein